MGERMRAMDWASTALGPVDRWPQSLRSTVSLLLPSKAQIVLFWGPEFVALYNDAYRPVFGAKHPHVLGRPGREAWNEIWDSMLHDLLAGVVRTGEAFWAKDLLFGLERYGFLEETYFDVSYDPVRDESGSVGGVFCIVTETTERVIGERRLALLKDLAARNVAARTAREACVLATSTLAANPTDVTFALAYLDDELQSATPDAERKLAESSPTFVRELPILISGDRARAARLVVGLNTRRPFDDQYRAFLDLVAGQLEAALTNAVAYEQARQRAESLADLDRAKTAFFSNVSHEFRTPLTLLMAPVEDTLADAALPAEARNRLELAHRNAVRLLKLVNTLLDFARIEAGRVEASYEPTDLSRLTTELASNFRSTIERAGMTLTVDCPPLSEPVYVDREMWEKVTLNLLSNAFKFTFTGGVQVLIRQHDRSVTMQVRDTGTGIPPSEIGRLFERFHRVKGAQGRSYEGSGIGLALVQELARLHGGAVTVESELGRGSVFTVTVPLGSGHLPSERLSAAPTVGSTSLHADAFVQEASRWLRHDTESGPAATESAPDLVAHRTPLPRLRHARIVVADDNADMREYLQRILGEQYEVDAVGDGATALEHVRANPPDLVLADVMMPSLDGFGLLMAIRGDDQLRSLPVVLLSARAGEESRIEGLDAGADEYMVKPFSARELLACVASQLALARVRAEAEEERVRLLRETAAVTRTLNDVGAIVTSDLDRTRVVQAVTDAATELTTAAFGAFFYNVLNDAGESYTLYTISGVPKDSFSSFPMPRNTAVFDPTFKGTAVVRSDDITKDPRYGHNAPHHGMPRGHLPVRSYLAAPVKGRTGEVLGGLFFGHPEAGRFTEHHERLAAGIASWASVALENASLYASVQEASRLKDDFLASLSHELRTPLNAILGYARMLRTGAMAVERRQRAMETIERNATSLTQIVEDVLDISRIVSGKIRLNVQAVDLPQLVRNALDVIVPAAEAKGVRVETILDPEAAPVSGDPERLQQVFWNLLSNAVKFTERNGLVQVRLQRVDSHVEVVVSDTGIGIPPRFLPHVFERFRQAEGGPARERGGLGLGLSIARQLAEMHGGTIEASSDGVGRGATFRVKIPLMILSKAAEAPSSVFPRSTPDIPARIGEGELRGVTVLAVDDERDALGLLAEVLEAASATVTAARSAGEALTVLDSTVPDVLIADLGMPEVDGFQLIDRVRHHQNPRVRALPAAALTAYARSDDRMKALRSGFHIHLAKPIDPAELVTTIAALAKRYIQREPE
jgi:signal transduction histidine kinase/DNA-binding response OmpR family regulator